MSDLIYRPNLYEGEELFDGIPYTTNEVFETIGIEGVGFIHKAMAEMLETRKKMFGTFYKNSYGFHPRQQFIDLETRTYIELTSFQIDEVLSKKFKPLKISNKKNSNSYKIDLWSNVGSFNGPKKNRRNMVGYIQKHPFKKNFYEKIQDARNQVEFLQENGYS